MSSDLRPRPAILPDWAATSVPDAQGGYRELLRVPALSVGRFTARPGYNDNQDPHAEDEIYFVVRGRPRLLVDGETHLLEAGSLAYVPAGVEHRFTDVDDDVEVLVFFAAAPAAAHE